MARVAGWIAIAVVWGGVSACGGDDDDGDPTPRIDAAGASSDAQSGIDAAAQGDANAGIDAAPGASFLFAVEGRQDSASAGGTLYRIAVEDATATAVGSTGTGITGLAHGPDGTLYATEAIGDGSVLSDGRHWLQVDPETAAVTEVALQEVAIPDLTFLPDGRCIGWIAGDTLGMVALGPASIDLATGAHTAIGATDVTSAGSGLTVDDAGLVWLAATRTNCEGATLFAIDPVTGLGTAGPTLAGCPAGARRINSLAFHRGVLYGVTISAFGTGGTTTLVTIDRTTGAVATVGALPDNIDAIASGDPATVVSGVRAAPTWQLPPTVASDRARCPDGPPARLVSSRAGTGLARPVSDGPLAAVARGGDSVVRVVPCDGPVFEYRASALRADPDRVRIVTTRRGTRKLVLGSGGAARTQARELSRIELLP